MRERSPERLPRINQARLGCAQIQIEKIFRGENVTWSIEPMVRYVPLLTSIALISFSSITLAQDADRSQNRGACRDDARKLCAGIDRSSGRGAVLDCLASQKDKLSDECRKSVESRGK
jgi:hypothetical protein